MNFRFILVFALSSLFVLGLGCTKKHSGSASQTSGAPNAQAHSNINLPFNIEPSPSQKLELDKIRVEYEEKLRTAQEAVGKTIPLAKQKLRMEAANKARAAGKIGKDFIDAIENVAKLSPEEQKNFQEAQAALSKIGQEVSSKLQALLTPAQKDQVKKRAEELKKLSLGHKK
jgi:hypothetical protein